VVSEEALAGYLLEELLASLIQSAGYRLLTNPAQDPDELNANRKGDLRVRGRGGNHQVDVLGEFTFVPPFSQPLRLFVEAKARKTVTGLSVVRNAVGTINDVNEAWMVNYSSHRTRRHYRYALFSTSGFSSEAQNYALAHQVSLIDLSGPEWAELRDAVWATASELVRDALQVSAFFPVRELRQVLRRELRTAPDAIFGIADNPAHLHPSLLSGVQRLRTRFREAVGTALLVFPAGIQVQLARPDDLRAFLIRANLEPEHQVSLSVARDQGETRSRTWIVRPLRDRDSYTLRLTLPAAIEELVLAEGDRRAQVLLAKGQLGGRLDVYWDPRNQDTDVLGPRLFRLAFPNSELRERRPEAW
jgi:hypothetical protein